MKLVTHLLSLSLALQGASAFFGSSNEVGAMLESRANGKMPSYQQVLAASLAKYPGMKSADNSGTFRYNLKPCNAKCEKKNEVQDKEGNCKPCPNGQKPDKDQTKCVPNGGKEQGKCENGKVLDPMAGGQDANTENPKCISDDDNKCPEGQRAESRRKGRDVDESTYEPSCATDEDPDFKCDDPNTYNHKTIQDDKIRHSCRSTKKHDDDKINKYDERVKESKSNKERNSGDLQKERRKKNRTGWCFVAVASVGAFDSFADEINTLTNDEIEGMYAQFPDNAPDPSGDGSIPNYVVSVRKSTAVPFVEGAGPVGSVGGAIAKVIAGAKGFASASIRQIRSGSRKGPSSIAKKAGSKSSTIEKIFKDYRMLDCVFSSATLAGASKSKRAPNPDPTVIGGGGMVISIYWQLTPEMSKPAPEGVSITLGYSAHEDMFSFYSETRHDTYYSHYRLPYEACTRPSSAGNGIVSLMVDGGCCAFYDGYNCESDTHLFDMYNREHQDLQGKDRGTISSYWCTAAEHCPGKP